MEFFNRLGDGLLESWRAHNFDEQVFPDLAVAATSALRPSDHVTLEDVVDAVHDARRLVPQGDLTNLFGSPPVRIYDCERFFIEVLFWVDATTGVHQHRFCGAFHVLEGSSLQAEHRFAQEHRYSDRLKIGRLDLEKVEHLKKGDVRAIRTGDQLIHSLFHLDRPSISVVVRTHVDPIVGPQYQYTRDGIAFDPFFMTDVLKRQQQTLGLLLAIDHPKLFDRARRTIEAADAFTAFSLLSWMRVAVPDEKYGKFLDELRSPHTLLLERLRRDRDEQLREAAITMRRARIRGKEHRFLLALLLNLGDRRRIFEVVGQAYPEAPPEQTVLRWVSELAKTPMEDGGNALGIEMPESSLQIFSHLLEGAGDAQVVTRLREEYGDVDDQVDGIRELCAAFRESLLFRTLLAA
jgi:hypothetical protein